MIIVGYHTCQFPDRFGFPLWTGQLLHYNAGTETKLKAWIFMDSWERNVTVEKGELEWEKVGKTEIQNWRLGEN